MATVVAVTVCAQVIEVSKIFDTEVMEQNIIPVSDNGKALILLAGVPSGLSAGKQTVIQNNNDYIAFTVTDAIILTPQAQGILIPQLQITLDGVLPDSWGNDELIIWYSPVPAGEMIKLPKAVVEVADLEMGIFVDGIPGASMDVGNQPVVLRASDGLLVTCEGEITTENGVSKFTATKILHGEGPLVPPITGYIGLSHFTRGETVKSEILGSGDASIPFQTFRLKKSPLTYLASPNGPAAQIEVYVNGQQWTHASSFYGARPTDQIYTVRHDEDHATIITFGDGELGQRVPTGSSNVVATYRFGVGGNVPANSITALKKPVKGIRKVFNPLPATGGRDVPSREELRRNAPLSTLVLGRLVSLPDFEAEARQWGNVVNAKATRGWDESRDRAVVQLSVVTPDTGPLSTDLCAYLAGLAEPNIALTVIKATAQSGTLIIDLDIDPKRQREVVELAVAHHLFHEYDGLLALRNVPIGGRFHRSKLLAAIHQVPGVIGVAAVRFNWEKLPPSLTIFPGKYFDCRTIGLMVGSTEAGKQLFGGE
jgi:hypothetical protein